MYGSSLGITEVERKALVHLDPGRVGGQGHPVFTRVARLGLAVRSGGRPGHSSRPDRDPPVAADAHPGKCSRGHRASVPTVSGFRAWSPAPSRRDPTTAGPDRPATAAAHGRWPQTVNSAHTGSTMSGHVRSGVGDGVVAADGGGRSARPRSSRTPPPAWSPRWPWPPRIPITDAVLERGHRCGRPRTGRHRPRWPQPGVNPTPA